MKAPQPEWLTEAPSGYTTMMQIECPFCGRRDETEFSYGGEAHIARPAPDVDDETWVEYLYFRNNMKGIHAERWRHSRGCGSLADDRGDRAAHIDGTG